MAVGQGIRKGNPMVNEVAKRVWRYQCDPQVGPEDTMVQLFMEESATVGDRVFVDKKTVPIPVRMLDLFGPLSLLDPERIEGLVGAPASDRIVPLNHNQPEYTEAVEALDKLEKAISGNNELSEAERVAAGAEVSALKKLLSATYVYGKRLIIGGATAMLTIAATIEHEVISTLASDAAHRLIQLAHTLM
jgi:hypothetical protein